MKPLVMAVVLILIWYLMYGVFRLPGVMVHLLLVLALVSICWNFINGRRVPR